MVSLSLSLSLQLPLAIWHQSTVDVVENGNRTICEYEETHSTVVSIWMCLNSNNRWGKAGPKKRDKQTDWL